MQRCLSVGVATLVALMAAHRKAAGNRGARSAGLDQNVVAGVLRELDVDDLTAKDAWDERSPAQIENR